MIVFFKIYNFLNIVLIEHLDVIMIKFLISSMIESASLYILLV